MVKIKISFRWSWTIPRDILIRNARIGLSKFDFKKIVTRAW